MYVDTDLSGRYSIMELNDEHLRIITDALVRFACCPSKQKSQRNQAKHIALKLTEQHDYTQFTDQQNAS